MRVTHIALGGCLRPPPVAYGLTEDTGGHIAFVLGAAMAQARRPGIRQVDIVTRLFEDPGLGASHALPREAVAPRCDILRLRTANTAYLCKEALEAEIPALAEAFVDLVGRMAGEPAGRPDVIHAHFGDAAVLARAAERRFGIPWTFSSHSLAAGKDGAGASRRMARERAALRGAGAIVASSRDEAERQLPAYDPLTEGRTHRVGPGVTAQRRADPDRARRLIAPFLRAPDRPVILAIARPIRKKNLLGLVEAFAAAPALRDAANLVILAGLRDGLADTGEEGAGVLRELFDAVDRHDLWGRVALPRRHDSPDVAALYALAAEGGVFVNPARHEPFGLTLIEAAQAGVPVVATSNGGPADIVAGLGYGALVDPGDRAGLAEAIGRILSDPDRPARAAAAARRAHELYDWGHWAARVEDVYAGLSAAPPVEGRPRRLVVCDIDGTLTGDRAAARRFAGWHAGRGPQTGFAVATGRSVTEARRVLADWDLPLPDLLITSVGTEIWRWSGPGALTLCPRFAAEAEAGWDRAAVAEALVPLALAPQAPFEQRRWKLSFLGSPLDARRAELALRAAGLGARVVHSHGRLIDVLPPRAGKAAAVRHAARHVGLPEGACVVAGDSGNDRDMLEGFAHAILPANAEPGLGALPHAYRSPLSHADGVLDGLARLGLARGAAPLLAAE